MYASLSTVNKTNNHDSEKSLSAIQLRVIACANWSLFGSFETNFEIVYESDFYLRDPNLNRIL